jgi:TRAP-type uncharacterized transport system fused permease subunit
MFLGFIYYPICTKRFSLTANYVINGVLMIGSAVSLLYVVLNNRYILTRMAMIDPVSDLQFVLGIILVISVIELARRTLGWGMPI